MKLNPNHNLPPKKTMTSPLQCQLCFSPIVCCLFSFRSGFVACFWARVFSPRSYLAARKSPRLGVFFLPQGLCPSTWFTYNYTMKNICIHTLKFWTLLFFGGQGKCVDIYKCVAMTVMIVFLCFVSLFLWFLLFSFGRPGRHPNANCQ